MTRISISPAGEPYWSEPKPKRKAAAREPAGAGLPYGGHPEFGPRFMANQASPSIAGWEALAKDVLLAWEAARAVRDSAGTICKCGLAKSYHAARFGQREHEYEPRYPAAREPAGAGLREAAERVVTLLLTSGREPPPLNDSGLLSTLHYYAGPNARTAVDPVEAARVTALSEAAFALRAALSGPKP